MLSKIKTFGFQINCTRYGKNVKKQNCLFQEDVEIYFRELFNRARSFRFNCKNYILKSTRWIHYDWFE